MTGLLVVAYAIEIWRLLHPGQGSTWEPLLVGAYGMGLVTAGVFTPDLQVGFLPGSPEGISSAGSVHARLHYLAFFALIPSLVAACFVFARRFATLRLRQWGLVAYCLPTAEYPCLEWQQLPRHGLQSSRCGCWPNIKRV